MPLIFKNDSMKLKHAIALILLVVFADQALKIYIKTHFMENQMISIFSWFKIRFIENEGAAWGVKIPGEYGKLALTLFRLIAILGIGYWLCDAIKKHAPNVLILSVTLIFAGALGNIIDSVFYGVIFNHSYGQVATLFSPTPYGTLFHGKVVDMFYFPLIDTVLPQWIPFWGGQRFTFFDPVFNIADTAISIAVGMLIIFNKKIFK